MLVDWVDVSSIPSSSEHDRVYHGWIGWLNSQKGLMMTFEKLYAEQQVLSSKYDSFNFKHVNYRAVCNLNVETCNILTPIKDYILRQY